MPKQSTPAQRAEFPPDVDIGVPPLELPLDLLGRGPTELPPCPSPSIRKVVQLSRPSDPFFARSGAESEFHPRITYGCFSLSAQSSCSSLSRSSLLADVWTAANQRSSISVRLLGGISSMNSMTRFSLAEFTKSSNKCLYA